MSSGLELGRIYRDSRSAEAGENRVGRVSHSGSLGESRHQQEVEEDGMADSGAGRWKQIVETEDFQARTG